MMDAPWFTNTDFTSLEIRQYKSLADHTVVKSARINDVAYVQQLAGRIAQIPAKGDMMVSFSGTAEHMELLFYSGDQVQPVQVIQRRFKTPSTGFNANGESEKALYAEVLSVLCPLRHLPF